MAGRQSLFNKASAAQDQDSILIEHLMCRSRKFEAFEDKRRTFKVFIDKSRTTEVVVYKSRIFQVFVDTSRTFEEVKDV